MNSTLIVHTDPLCIRPYPQALTHKFSISWTFQDWQFSAYCIENGHELLYKDQDFDPFEDHLGLKVVHP